MGSQMRTDNSLYKMLTPVFWFFMPGTCISWTAETVKNVVPPLSVSKTEMTKLQSQYFSVMV